MGENLGRLIKEIRETSGMSQVELAEILDVSPRQVQRFESGECLTVSRLLQIAEAFGVPVDVFMEKSGPDRHREPGYMQLSPDEIWLIFLYRSLRSKRVKEGFVEMLENLSDLQN